ncbi:MAG: hypothetical protein QOI36_3622 [Pseudonocardiales bacterium]|nr:hypothetical protein [Pseudonocardiales bacterium]
MGRDVMEQCRWHHSRRASPPLAPGVFHDRHGIDPRSGPHAPHRPADQPFPQQIRECPEGDPAGRCPNPRTGAMHVEDLGTQLAPPSPTTGRSTAAGLRRARDTAGDAAARPAGDVSGGRRRQRRAGRRVAARPGQQLADLVVSGAAPRPPRPRHRPGPARSRPVRETRHRRLLAGRLRGRAA